MDAQQEIVKLEEQVALPAMQGYGIPICLEWRDRIRRLLPRQELMWCDVLTLTPRLRLRWWYTEEQYTEGDVWECGTVWLHCAHLANGTVYSADVHRDLEEALRVIASDPAKARYTLLVSPDGMSYDTTCLGGNHHVNLPNGRRFIFTVRRGVGRYHKVLLALCWNDSKGLTKE